MTMTTTTTTTASLTPSLLTTKRKNLIDLDARKKSLLIEAEAIVSELTAELPDGTPPIGIDTPLVDAEGYPRGDIDVYRARSLRKQFKEIQNDHKSLEKQIELGLLEIAALSSDSTNTNGGGKGEKGEKGGGISSSSSSGGGVSTTTPKEDEAEKRARLAPKPKPKYDPKTGKWVVSSWDGSVAGVEHGETRSFDNLNSNSNAALASIAGIGRTMRSDDGTVGTGEGNVPPTGTFTASSAAQTRRQNQQQVSFQQQLHTTPFAIINEVTPSSPAHEANLQKGDVLLNFGHIHASNHDNFKAIAKLVSEAGEDQSAIAVSVRRKSTELGGVVEVIRTVTVELRPRTWSGRGLLGCHILPYTE